MLSILDAVVELPYEAVAHIKVGVVELIPVDVGGVVVLPVRSSLRRKPVVSDLRFTEGISDRGIQPMSEVLAQRSGDVVAIPLVGVAQQNEVGVLVPFLTGVDRTYFSRGVDDLRGLLQP